MVADLNVVELFVSLQGEGPSSGERAVFVRLADCNLKCSWCDTQYSWNWHVFDRAAEVLTANVDELVSQVLAVGDDSLRLLVLTGGEPMLQQRPVIEFLVALSQRSRALRCEIETNGTVSPAAEMKSLVRRFIVSPKLSSSGNKDSARIRDRILAAYVALEATVFKFVIATSLDITEVIDLVAKCEIERSRVWLMPEADSRARLLELGPHVANLALVNGFNYSSRGHIVLWDDARGC